MKMTASMPNVLRQQFRDLEGRHPGLWPPLPRSLCAIAVLLAVVAAGGWLVWQPQWEDLDRGRETEQRLRAEFENKVAQAQNLDSLRRQKAEVEAQVGRLERQLPGKAEMDALLAEISQSGVGRGLQFELFKPGQLNFGDYYAELPIEVRLTGNFHALASFVSDVANLPRIVTIDHIAITQQREGMLFFEGVAHAFRYLDPAEAEQKKQQAIERKKRVKQ
jgi:type IV pilus assembly protein PilO